MNDRSLDDDDGEIEDPTITSTGILHNKELTDFLEKKAKEIQACTGGTVAIHVVTCEHDTMTRCNAIYGSYGEALAGAIAWLKQNNMA